MPGDTAYPDRELFTAYDATHHHKDIVSQDPLGELIGCRYLVPEKIDQGLAGNVLAEGKKGLDYGDLFGMPKFGAALGAGYGVVRYYLFTLHSMWPMARQMGIYSRDHYHYSSFD